MSAFPVMKPEIAWLKLPARNSRPVWAILCLALFVVLQLFAASGPLHKSFHADSDTPDHHCVITLLAQGKVTPATASLWVAIFIALFLFFLPQITAVFYSSFDYRFSSSRAPPRF